MHEKAWDNYRHVLVKASDIVKIRQNGIFWIYRERLSFDPPLKSCLQEGDRRSLELGAEVS